MKNALISAFAALVSAGVMSPALHASTPVAHVMTAGTVKVTVTYKGKGTVDATHKLWVYLFDNPNIGAGSMPIGQIALEQNGGDAIFENVAGDKVFVAVAFDEQGTMFGEGPPPTGSPIGVLMGADGMPIGVAPGGKPVALAFDDTIRMP
jgi:hypothetical protein